MSEIELAIQIQKSFILLSEEYIHFTLLKQVN